jgi:hypothetical protein
MLLVFVILVLLFLVDKNNNFLDQFRLSVDEKPLVSPLLFNIYHLLLWFIIHHLLLIIYYYYYYYLLFIIYYYYLLFIIYYL